MANTFKVKTFDGSSTAANALMNIYTVPAATTTVIVGLTVANTSASQITVNIKLSAASTIFLAKNIPIPAGSSFEYMSGNKLILETTHTISVSSDTANSLDTALSIMEQT
tara:strand:+ start:717 stop:1046 length:330 start_codon:yes stop_codon:yes gene_type:complete